MEYPIVYLWFFLALICGYFIGAGICLALMAPLKKRAKKQKNNKQRRKHESTSIEEMEEKRQKEERQGILQSRLIDKSDSWTDFNCAADSVDSEEYIRQRRKMQDKAYQYVKNQIEKNKENE